MALLRPLLLLRSARTLAALAPASHRSVLSSNPSGVLQVAARTFSSAMSYESEKEKYLNMPREEKAKFYKCKKGVKLDEVLTWQELAEEEGLEPSKKTKLEAARDFDLEVNQKVSIWEGDITTLEIDVIVNAANAGLHRGGGVCGAIFDAAGSRSLEEECRKLSPCKPGSAKMTGGYKLPATHILHAVGPTDKDPKVLESCYKKCLEYIRSSDIMPDIKSMAFPCIATGIYGFPNDKAAEIAISTVRDFLEQRGELVDRIIFCLFSPEDKKLYRQLMLKYFPLN